MKETVPGTCEEIEPRQSVISWIPIDPAIPERTLQDKLDSRQAGTLYYRVIWLEDVPTARGNGGNGDRHDISYLMNDIMPGNMPESKLEIRKYRACPAFPSQAGSGAWVKHR